MNTPARISTPEQFYDRIDEPQTTELGAAYHGLVEVLDLKTVPPVGLHGLFEWQHVSDELINQSDTVLKVDRNVPVVASRVVSLMKAYPWLQAFPHGENPRPAIGSRDMNFWSKHKLFESLPGLFGVSPWEAYALQTTFTGHQHAEKLPILCEEIGIVFKPIR